MGRDNETLLRKFHQARWDEEIIFEQSVPGERGVLVPKAESQIQDAVGDGVSVIPDSLRRKTAAALPEVNQVRVNRHFMRLSQETLGTDVTIDISQGTCTMKYSPKVQEHIATRIPVSPKSIRCRMRTPSRGSSKSINHLEKFLQEISGLDHFTFQPRRRSPGGLYQCQHYQGVSRLQRRSSTRRNHYHHVFPSL